MAKFQIYPTSCRVNAGETEIIYSVQGKEVVQELFSLFLTAQERLSFVLASEQVLVG